MSEKIPDCPYCKGSRVKHEQDYMSDGSLEDAWFDCESCGFQWNNYELSRRLLNLSPTAALAEGEE